MGTRLFVGNLPFSVDESELRELFSQNDRNVAEVKLITDRDTGRPRGFGFVEMGSSEEADQAIRELNGYELQGRQLNVNEARERTRDGGGGGGGGYRRF
jgi:RNA recognition motif-containing protein